MADTAAPVLAGPEIISMGCRLNIAEGEAMRALLAGRDDVVVINSCAVTNEAVRQTRQAIRKARPDAQVVVTGCAAQTDPAMFAAMPEVDRVLGNVEKLEATAFTVPGPFVPSEVEGRDLGRLRYVPRHARDKRRGEGCCEPRQSLARSGCGLRARAALRANRHPPARAVERTR